MIRVLRGVQLRIVWAYWWLKGKRYSYQEWLDLGDLYGLCWEDYRPKWWLAKWWGGVKVTRGGKI